MISDKLLRLPLVIIVFIIGEIAAEIGKKCSTTSLTEGGCADNETCLVNAAKDVEGVCECIPGYVPVGNDCLKSDATMPVEESHILRWTFASLIFIALVIVGVYLSYKLRVVSWLKYKWNQRYSRSYDDVMIGQDEE